MATQPRLVNKQFNSPIGLYSEANVREVLERESQILANGAVGINFHNPTVGKPTNLQNSAVLRMLEEEDRQRNGHPPGNDSFYARPLRDNITWPPPEYEQKHQLQRTFKDVVTPGVKRVAWPPPNEGGEYVEQNAVQSQGGPVHGQTVPPPQIRSVATPTPAQPSKPLTPLNISHGIQSSPSPQSPNLNASPIGFRPTTPNRQWAPVQSPVQAPPSNQFYSPQPQQQFQSQFQSPQNQYQAPQNQYQNPQNQFQSPQSQYQAPQQQYQAPQQFQGYQGPQNQYQAPQAQYQNPQNQFQSPQSQFQAPQQQYQAPQQFQGYQSPQNQFQSSQSQYQVHPQQYQASPVYNNNLNNQYQAPQASSQLSGQSTVAAQNQAAASNPRPTSFVPSSPASKPFEPPPSVITLRPKAPVSQAPPPVISSQPATATLRGGKHLRGDLKWPPEEVKAQMEEENRQRIELARGPACRPRKVHKDYSSFFAQHALNNAYPGYKIPPGTQFFRPV